MHFACKSRSRNDLYCVEWDVKPYSVTQLCRCYCLFGWFSKKLPDSDPATQIETQLDVSLRKWRMSELSSIVDEVRQLRGSVTDVSVAVEELDIQLTTLRKLAYDVRCLDMVFLHKTVCKATERN